MYHPQGRVLVRALAAVPGTVPAYRVRGPGLETAAAREPDPVTGRKVAGDRGPAGLVDPVRARAGPVKAQAVQGLAREPKKAAARERVVVAVPTFQVQGPGLETALAVREPDPVADREAAGDQGPAGLVEPVRGTAGPVKVQAMQELAPGPERAAALEPVAAVVPVTALARAQLVVPARTADRVALAGREPAQPAPAATATCCFSNWK